MGTARVEVEQHQLLRRIEQLVPFIKRDLGYRGSQDTGDLGATVYLRLLSSSDLRNKFEAEPKALRGLLRRLVRFVVIEAIREKVTRKRTRPDDAQFRVEWAIQRGDADVHRTPYLERDAQRHRDVALVMQELERFRLGEDDSRIGGSRRARMVQALTLHWNGNSYAEIAKELSVPKATVGHSIQALSLLLARRVASAGAVGITPENSNSELPASGVAHAGGTH